MAAGDLTTLDNVKAWLNSGSAQAQPGADDKLLARLITAASGWVPTYLSRSIVPQQYSDTYNGSGTTRQYLRNRPVVTVTSLLVDGVAIQPSTPPPLGNGYLFDDSMVYLVWGNFPMFAQNVQVTYIAGFQTSQNVSAPGVLFSVAGLAQTWNADRGVSYTGGLPLAQVASGPAVGQYSVSFQSNGLAAYNFNAADAGAALTITFGYTPADLEQSVIELVGETYKRRTRIGISSSHLAQQSTSFSVKVLNEAALDNLNKYKNVATVL